MPIIYWIYCGIEGHSGKTLVNDLLVVSMRFPTEGGNIMAETRVRKNESLDSALRRFKRSCAKSGVMSEVRKRKYYEKPSVKRKKKSEAARKRKF